MNIVLPSIYKVAAHTKHIGPGSTFVAIPGSKQNGISFISDALDKGASEIVVELDTILPDELINRCEQTGVAITFCANARKALACLSALAYNFPAKKLKIIGVTGTKGKTTSVYLLYHLLKSAGKPAALLSGVENKIGDTTFSAELTTAQPDYLHMFFDQCVQHGIEYVVMEAAAQAFSLHRLDTIEFDAGVFTNFSMEHAEFYTNIEDYFDAKKLILKQIKASGFLCINSDDTWINSLIPDIKKPVTFALNDKQAQYKAQVVKADMNGVEVEIQTPTQKDVLTSSTLVGRYNVYNLLGVSSVALQFGLSLEQISAALSTFTRAPGRLERYTTSRGVTCIVDYAHNPSSYEALLSMLAPYTNELIVVFGCGGERAQDKRPVMGALATAYAHHAVLTSDNPRSEKPEDIIAHIMSGISDVDKVTIELDRSTAIAKAIAMAEPGAIVAILGKGPDEYQQIGSQKYFFSDRQEVMKHL